MGPIANLTELAKRPTETPNSNEVRFTIRDIKSPQEKARRTELCDDCGSMIRTSQERIAKFINPPRSNAEKGLAFGSKESVCMDGSRVE